jgi:hypothetical protein
MILGLLLDDYRSSTDLAQPDVGSSDLPSDGGLSNLDSDKLRVPVPGSDRFFFHYYRDMDRGPRQSANDLSRRRTKGVVMSKRCPGCNWVPHWKSAIGPHPVAETDIIYCSKKCFENGLGLR